jgi:hypothetical protein
MAVVTVKPLRSGDAGTDDTVRAMESVVKAALTDLQVRDTAVRVVARAGVRPKNYVGEVNAIFQFVRDRVRYVKDPVGVELVHSPTEVLKRMAGDCDDKAVVLSALLQAVGHKTRFEVVAVRPGEFHHVTVRVLLGGKWVPLDPTIEQATPGWEHPRIIRRKVYGESASVADLGGYDFREVESISRTVNREYLEAAARAEVIRTLAAGQISSIDLRLSREFLSKEAKFSLPEWQRRMMDKLASEAEEVLRRRPALDASRGGIGGISGAENIGGFFGDVWKGIKKGVGTVAKVVVGAVKVVAKVAKVAGPALIIIPGIGPVAAAAVTAAGNIIAPGQPIPPDAIPINQLPNGYEINVTGAVTPASVAPAAAVVTTQVQTTTQPTDTASGFFSQSAAGVPMFVWLGAGALALILIAKR